MAGTMPTCTPGEGRGRRWRGAWRRRRPAGEAAAQPTPEALAAAEELRKWRTSVSMDKVKQLRKMYNDAGVTIYAYKSDGMQKNMQTTDAELDYLFNVAAALGATHTTMELPGPGPDGTAMLKRMAQFAEKHKVSIAYHTHAQGSMTAFDEALAMSKWNMSNVDLGHYVAGGQQRRFADRVPRGSPRPHRELPPEGSHAAGALLADGAVRQGRRPDQGHPAADEEEQVDVPGHDRARVADPCGLGRGQGSEEVRRFRQDDPRLTSPLVSARNIGPAHEPARLSLESVSG